MPQTTSLCVQQMSPHDTQPYRSRVYLGHPASRTCSKVGFHNLSYAEMFGPPGLSPPGLGHIRSDTMQQLLVAPTGTVNSVKRAGSSETGVMSLSAQRPTVEL